MKSKTGIYLIELQGKKYIGQTVDFTRREGEHFRSLRTNTHYNRYLQNTYNKYGEEDLSFKVLQVVDYTLIQRVSTTELSVLLESLEQTWMNILGAEFNPSGASISSLGLKNAKPFILVSPEGDLIEGSNLQKFARDNNLAQGNLSKVIRGLISNYKGWTASLEAHNLYKKSLIERGVFLSKGKWVLAYYVNGKQKREIFKTREEALIRRDEKEKEGYIFKVLLKSVKEKSQKNHKLAKTFELVNPEGEVIKECGISKFCEKNKLNYSTIVDLINGKVLQSQGYTRDLKSYNLYKELLENRGLFYCNHYKKWFVKWLVNGKYKSRSFKEREEAVVLRNSLEKGGYIFKVTFPKDWKKKLNGQEDK